MFKKAKRALAPIFMAFIVLFVTAKVSTLTLNADETVEGRTLRFINETRTAEGIEELTINEQLNKDAQIRAKEAAEKWSHTRPNDKPFWTVDEVLVYGENLGWYNRNTSKLDTIFQMWLDSESHRENIVDPDYGEVGIGVYVADDGKVYIAQEFGLKKNKKKGDGDILAAGIAENIWLLLLGLIILFIRSISGIRLSREASLESQKPSTKKSC